MQTFRAITLGLLVGGAAGCFVGVIFQIKDLQGSDGLVPGFAWLILCILTFLGMVSGAVLGWFWAPRLNKFLAGLNLKEQLKPSSERHDVHGTTMTCEEEQD